ncbi:unnamed protein product [Malus baccata var. baccata]
MGDPLRSSRVSSQKQNREGVFGTQNGQYRAMAELSPGCGGSLGRDVTRKVQMTMYQSKMIKHLRV